MSVTPTLCWNSSDPDGDALLYDVYFDTTTIPQLVSSYQSADSFLPGTLVLGKMYYWRIVAKDPKGASTSSETWYFTTGLPEPPPITGAYKGRYYVILNPGDNEIERYQLINFEFDDISYRMNIDTLDPNKTTFKICKVSGKYNLGDNVALDQITSGPMGGPLFSTCNGDDNPEGQFGVIRKGDSLILNQQVTTPEGTLLKRISLKRQ
ncbi:MAG: hypothetical protein AAB305_05440 [Candidatus Zixiibacteriota bacterium]